MRVPYFDRLRLLWYRGYKGSIAKPGTVMDALGQYPETSAALSAAETILDLKTEAARDVEAARVKHHRSEARRPRPTRGGEVRGRVEESYERVDTEELV
jgi:hypothetical protein